MQRYRGKFIVPDSTGEFVMYDDHVKELILKHIEGALSPYMNKQP